MAKYICREVPPPNDLDGCGWTREMTKFFMNVELEPAIGSSGLAVLISRRGNIPLQRVDGKKDTGWRHFYYFKPHWLTIVNATIPYADGF